MNAETIPQRELDAARWPTLEAQIARARVRIEAAERAAAEATRHHALGHVRAPHVNYHRREAANWRRHLDELLDLDPHAFGLGHA